MKGKSHLAIIAAAVATSAILPAFLRADAFDASKYELSFDIKFSGADLSHARCHITDTVRTYTEVPLEFDADGTAVIRLMPNSFAIVEW